MGPTRTHRRCDMSHIIRRLAIFGMAVLLLVGTVSALRAPMLDLLGAFLVIETPLEAAAAIVVLGGGLPFREIEAARIFQAAWAPQIFLVPGTNHERDQALRTIGMAPLVDWEVRRDALVHLGVPAEAIHVAEDSAENTLEELCVAAKALKPGRAPVILVTTPFHTRRVRLIWNYVTGGQSPGIVRSTSRDGGARRRWWEERDSIITVQREYLGLLNLWTGFPVRASAEDEHSPGRCAWPGMVYRLGL